MKSLRLLLVEDSEDDAALVLREIARGGFTLRHQRVDTAEDFLGALRAGSWDLVIADYSMPRFSGSDALELLNQHGYEVPFIFVSGTIGEEVAVEAMRIGAQDYVLKANLKRLVPVIERELREASVRRQSRELQEQLLQAQRLEAVGRLAGGVAHDFNNLLTVVLGVSALLQSDPSVTASVRASLQEIRDAAERAAVLTRQLLTFSRRQVFQPGIVNVNEVVRDVERMLRRLIGEDIEVRAELDSDLGSVIADRAQLEQVLLNLAINARDAMPRGGTLVIETANSELDQGSLPVSNGLAPGAYVRLTVHDTGCGMSEEVRARIFEPFFTTKEEGRGTGLGLATCSTIVQELAGWIGVDSAPGDGTSIHVFLPRTQQQAQAPLSLHVRLPRGSETVLLLEDETSVRSVIRRILTGLGYLVLEAGDAATALDLLRRHRHEIALLLTDVVLPESSGWEVAERALEISPAMRILFVSGYADHSVLGDRLPPGEADVLSKPLTQDAIARKVRQVLDAPRRQGRLASQ